MVKRTVSMAGLDSDDEILSNVYSEMLIIDSTQKKRN